jgi:hypothetical protein
MILSDNQLMDMLGQLAAGKIAHVKSMSVDREVKYESLETGTRRHPVRWDAEETRVVSNE